MSFSKIKILNIIFAVILVAYFLMIDRILPLSPITVTILFVLIIADLIFNLKFWRCPHCDRYLRKLPLFAEHCPYCGNELI